MKTILILTANPQNSTMLPLSEEVRDIKAALARSRNRDRFRICVQEAVRPDDVRRSLLDEKPQVLHFSGHGGGEHGLVALDESGAAQFVKPAPLAQFFEALELPLECVLLNACYSQVQAEAIAPYADCLIGMSQKVGDRTARKFAVAFYDALFAGKAMPSAFKLGRAAIAMENLPGDQTPILLQRGAEPAPATSATGARIFISYKRDARPDEQVALQLYEALRPQHTVFIDQTMPVGTHWVEQIRTEIRQADYLIALLSAASIRSQMLAEEVELAYHLARETGGKPAILPVRVAYQEPFEYPLSEYLNPINWAFWQDEGDTPGLIAELQAAIAGEALPFDSQTVKDSLVRELPSESLPPPRPSAPLELPEGTMAAESKFYVEREVDAIALDAIQQQGVTLTIKGPRQMGKSSLLVRVVQAAVAAGKQVVFLDFQFFDRAVLANADAFYQQFCTLLTDDLELEDKVAEYWQRPLSNSQRCTRYLGRHLLKASAGPVLLAMDEVDRLFDTEFRSDFFSMLRGWHNQRALKPLWKQLDLALVTSTEPYQLIEDLNQSPFNVGQVLELDDFAPEQVAALNQQHGQPLDARAEQRLIELTNGHPYLVRRALYLVASQQCSVAALFQQAKEARGPFGDHLRYHLFRMYDKPELVQGLLRVIRGQDCPDEAVFFRLRGAGLVRREAKIARPRCQLYAEYFREHLS